MKNAIIILMFVLISQGLFAKSSCETSESMTVELNKKTEVYCGVGLTWDLTGFVPDNSICESRQQGLNLIFRVVEEICGASAADLLSKLATIRVEAALIQEAEYKLAVKTLAARVPIKEAPVLSKWNEETDKLRKFLKSATGLKLMTAQEKEKQKSEIEKAKVEFAEAKKDRAREEKQQNRQEKIKKISEQFRLAGEKYAARVKQIWSAPGNDQAAIQKKTEDAAKAQKEFDEAQAEFEILKKTID